MKSRNFSVPYSIVAIPLLFTTTFGTAQAQQAPPTTVQEVVVTGSRIAQSEAQREQPLSTISTEAIERTGLADVGTLLQQLTTGGSALNGKFNSSGNFGYPPDGGGIGAGSAQVDLRNLESKRTLVLVDGLRWVNESSASGVSGSADLNTIPLSIIDRIEILEDGASSIYGSDAIAGVVNVITKKKFDGVELSGYAGEYGKGGRTTQGSVTVGGSSEKFSGMFVASYYNNDAISSADWWQSEFPQPFAGLAAGSSGIVQGLASFCDPRRPPAGVGGCTPDQKNYYGVVPNTGTTMPVWDPANPTGGTYHNFDTPDRYNFAPFNLLLTPSQRKSIFTNMSYSINENVEAYVKGLFNNRTSKNQAAPEPIFVGPGAQTGGLADTIPISGKNPYNPFGIDLTPGVNLDRVTRRPIEGGPRVFTQDVDTWYFSAGLRGSFQLLSSNYHWDVNFADSENKATQRFSGGYNLANVQLALGDPAVCATVPNCVPLDLFGGQGRPITPAMLKFIGATQIDSSVQTLRLVSANITGHPFSIQDRPVGIAVGAEHRNYTGQFNPDPLRQTGLSQDSPAFAVNQAYKVNEAYVELSVPILASLGGSAAARYSDYSNFGSTATFKGGLRWQPTEDFGLRGTYSTGFRAPNLGELFGLTSFAATLTDPCGPTKGAVDPRFAAGCARQGVPAGFQQTNTQIVTFTGGNPNLRPEKSDSYTTGFVYNASWAQGLFFTDRLSLEATYYHHKIKGAIAPEDIQALLNACLTSGGGDPNTCTPFTRQASGNLNTPRNFLQNLGQITTHGEDLKLDWRSTRLPIGHFSAAVVTTRVNNFQQVDALGNVAQKQVGIEQNNSAIPRYRLNAVLGYGFADLEFTWTVRYLSAVEESCTSIVFVPVQGCQDRGAATFHELQSMTYNDVHASYTNAFKLQGLVLEAGVNNLFGANPPVCLSCTLNGYDAGTYDLPGAFWNVQAKYRF